MSDKPVKGTKKLTTANSPANAISFLVEQAIKETVNTAEVVSIDGADQNGTDGPGGYASATPLVCPIDGFNNALPSTAIPQMPFFRPQAGKAAIVMDPQPGDKAIAVFMKRDSSGVVSGQGGTVQPASFRSFDQADGYLINGFLGEAPEIWLKLDPVSGDISLSTKAANIDISCRESGDIAIRTKSGNITIEASGPSDTITLKATNIILDGNVTGRGGGRAQLSNGIDVKTGITNTGGVIKSNNITLDAHTHPGIMSGDSDTQSPNTGT